MGIRLKLWNGIGKMELIVCMGIGGNGNAEINARSSLGLLLGYIALTPTIL